MSIKSIKEEFKNDVSVTGEGAAIQVLPDEQTVTETSAERTGALLDESPVRPLMYLGPNLPGGRLLQSTVFRGGIPAYLEPLLTEQPDVSALIVPVDEISGTQARIIQTGTPEYAAYQAILRGDQGDGV